MSEETAVANEKGRDRASLPFVCDYAETNQYQHYVEPRESRSNAVSGRRNFRRQGAPSERGDGIVTYVEPRESRSNAVFGNLYTRN